MDTDDLLDMSSENDEDSWDSDGTTRNAWQPSGPKDFSEQKIVEDGLNDQIQRDREAKLNKFAFKEKLSSLKAKIKSNKTGDKDILLKKMDNKKYKSLEVSTLLAWIMGVKGEDARAKREDKVLKQIAQENQKITDNGKPTSKQTAIAKIKKAIASAKQKGARR